MIYSGCDLVNECPLSFTTVVLASSSFPGWSTVGGREIQGEISLPPPWDGFFGGTEEEEEAPTKGCKLFMREERRSRRNRDGRGPPTTFSFSFLVLK